MFKLDNPPAVFPLEIVRGPQRFTLFALVDGQYFDGKQRILARCNWYDVRGQGVWEVVFEPEFLLSMADLIYRTFGKPPPTHVTVGMTYTPPPAPPPSSRDLEGPPDDEVAEIKKRMLEGR